MSSIKSNVLQISDHLDQYVFMFGVIFTSIIFTTRSVHFDFRVHFNEEGFSLEEKESDVRVSDYLRDVK